MRKLSISVYLIVPVIFGLFSIFSFVVSFQIFDYCVDRKLSPVPFLTTAVFLLFIISTFIGYYIIRFVLKPSERFIKKVKQSSAVRVTAGDKDNQDRFSDQMEEFTKLFDQVAQALDIMDADRLFPKIVGKSRSIRQVLSQIVKVAPTDSTVLIQGESGTGKELIAESIVEKSRRRGKPFIRINCAAISPNLMESELFGHERGAFTGAVSRKRGCFELAHKGTLFLDEIGDMPMELQVKLLRVLQESSFFRVGGDAPLKVDVRIIVATNKNLETMIADGSFREELFYRINVFPIYLPPVRERGDDVEALATYFLELIAPGKFFDPAAMELLKNYAWPGNVRELENIVERGAVLSDIQKMILPENLPILFKSTETLAKSFSGRSSIKTKEMTLDETLIEIEKSLICEALKKTGGIQVRAAEKLGINQRSLWNRLKKYQINAADYK